MAKDINLYSQEWCDIVFEGKNQDYGAYQVRLTSTRRNAIALISILLFTVFVAFLPTIISQAKAAIEKARMSGFTEEIKMTNLNVEVELPDDFVPPELPPPPMIASIKFTAPEITKSDEMTDDDVMKSQADLLDSKAAVSIMDYKGDDDLNAVDPRDIEVVKQAAPEKSEEPLRFADQMPEYPGGIEELYAYIRRATIYPQQAREAFIQGTVLLEFAVNRDGSIDKVSVKVSAHPLLDREAVRVVKTLPKWIPGKVNGKPVPVWYTLPISYTIQ
ncbi:MAG: energy transducer TonB [Bacteroidales bacterium]|jgi:protein TonB|nr:energy transducer TonB [Bacteroidales bacterium]